MLIYADVCAYVCYSYVAGASGVFDLIISDAVASPPDLLGTQGGRERVVILGHPARGGPTSFLSPLSHTAAHTLTTPPRVGGVTLLFSDKKKNLVRRKHKWVAGAQRWGWSRGR